MDRLGAFDATTGTLPRRQRQGLPTGSIARLVGFELRLQQREVFPWLAALVFFLLTFGYASTGVVMLVDGLGSTPRHAPWALAQAMAGVTAFGQVITAITAATTVLRDVGLRTQGLVLTTGLSWSHYLAGRLLGTLAVLLLVYLAIPAGLVAGITVAGLSAGADAPVLAWGSIGWPLLTLVLPNVWLVTACFFAAGALSGGFTVILFVGLGFIGLWQTGIALASAGIVAGALLDPFGNAALLWVTSGWSAEQRALSGIPLDGMLLGNRLLWASVGVALVAATFRWWHPAAGLRAARGALPSTARRTALSAARGTERIAAQLTQSVAARVGAGALTAQRPVPPSALATFSAEWRFGWRWVTRERGFAVLLALAVLNAVANGWRVAADPTALLRAVEFHARLFGILVATIYAGELTWRDRDVRAEQLLGVLPVRAALRVDGRATGVLTALLALPVALWAVTAVLPLLRGAVPAVACSASWLLGAAAAMFVVAFVVSLLVHRLVQHKTIGHLVLIAAWVGAIALGAEAAARPWSVWGWCG
jgi:ABC-2 type transport system permease protein